MPASKPRREPSVSRDDGNVARFCHWRQIERVIATLTSDEVRGTIHYRLSMRYAAR